MIRLSFKALLWALCVLGFLLVLPVSSSHESGGHINNLLTEYNESEGGHSSNTTHSGHGGSVHVASWRFYYVADPLIITLFVLTTAVFKVGMHHAKRMSAVIPESCMLIILGMIFGGLFLLGKPDEFKRTLMFDSQIFFLFLLPPIILESAYSLRDRAFVENLGTILLYAVVGTFFNIMLIGGLLYGLYMAGVLCASSLVIQPLYLFIFSSLISAIDPVAVLAIFQELGVNKALYFMVFGESLLNDAVTVVFYTLMVSLLEVPAIGAAEVGLGVAAFLCVSIGGGVIGIICGLITAFFTKFTRQVRVVEPIAVFAMAYLSYLLAEMVHFSGIISIICCGLAQSQYAWPNLSSKSYISINFFSRVASSVTESIIFIILGVMLVTEPHSWDTGFVMWTLLACIVIRFAVVYGLTGLVNWIEEGIRRISAHEQFIMGYGGLRGAVSFSLVFMLDPHLVPIKRTLLTTTMVVILFTAFVQIVENSVAGVEEIIGHWGHHYVINVIRHFSQKFLRPKLQRNFTGPGRSLVTAYTEASLQLKMQQVSSQERKLTANPDVVADSFAILEQAALPPSIGERMCDIEDTVASNPKKRKKSKTKRVRRVSEAEQMLNFRDMLSNPLHKLVMFHKMDRNMKSVRSDHNFQSLVHLTTRRNINRGRWGNAAVAALQQAGKPSGALEAVTEHNESAVGRSIVGSAFLPMAAGLMKSDKSPDPESPPTPPPPVARTKRPAGRHGSREEHKPIFQLESYDASPEQRPISKRSSRDSSGAENV